MVLCKPMNNETRDDLTLRLKRIAGQVGGLQRMLTEERSNADIVLQISAARAALAKVARILLHEHFAASLGQIVDQDAGARHQTIEGLLQMLERCDL
jgi:DNA-binding FrmR family transcriptional regulator